MGSNVDFPAFVEVLARLERLRGLGGQQNVQRLSIEALQRRLVLFMRTSAPRAAVE